MYVNNLYNWVSIIAFRWNDDTSNFNVVDIALDSPTGYILEVNLEYAQYLHDAHTNLLFCPTSDKPATG